MALLERSWNPSGLTTDVSLMTFNTLAECYATTEPQGFPFVDPNLLPWAYRSARMMDTLMPGGIAQADFYTLQEVDHYTDFFEPEFAKHNYSGLYKARTGAADGAALFYNTSKYQLLHVDYFFYEEGTNHLAIIGEFETVADQKPLVVVATHLKAKAEFFDIRLMQATKLAERLSTYKQPVLVGGDFNEEPQGKACVFFREHFASAYDADIVTTFKKRDKVYKRCIDYVYYRGLQLKSLYSLPTDKEMPDLLPATYHPSDHLNIAAQFQWL